MDEARDQTLTTSESTLLEKYSSQLKRTFNGSFTHGLDSKGRIIVPASFRPALGEKFIICLTPDMKAIALYSKMGWDLQYCHLMALLEKDMRMQRIINLFCKYTYDDCECDSQGRVLLPQKLRARFLADAKEVDVSGAGSYITVMSEEDARAEEERVLRDIPDMLAFETDVVARGR